MNNIIWMCSTMFCYHVHAPLGSSDAGIPTHTLCSIILLYSASSDIECPLVKKKLHQTNISKTSNHAYGPKGHFGKALLTLCKVLFQPTMFFFFWGHAETSQCVCTINEGLLESGRGRASTYCIIHYDDLCIDLQYSAKFHRYKSLHIARFPCHYLLHPLLLALMAM